MIINELHRINEMLYFKWQDFNWQENSVIVRKTKTGTARIVYFSVQVRSYLEQYVKGKIFKCQSLPIKKLFNATKKMAGITEPEITFYRMEHTLVSNLYMQGAVRSTIAELYGVSEQVLSEAYIQISNAFLKQAAAKVLF